MRAHRNNALGFHERVSRQFLDLEGVAFSHNGN